VRVKLSQAQARALGLVSPKRAGQRPREARPRRPKVQGELIPRGGIVCRFTARGRAVPWKPSRVTTNGTYKPKAVRDWQRIVHGAALAAMAGRPAYPGRVRVVLEFWHTSSAVGDWDNLAKAVVDATQGVVIVNDRQIKRAEVAIEQGDEDRVTITYYAAR